MSLKSLKVIKAKEMKRVENLAFERGESEVLFMQKAGEGIAKRIVEMNISKKIVLLLGKGNNAGDCLVCGSYLLKRGFLVRAKTFFDVSSASSLFLMNFEIFKKEGGVVEKISDKNSFETDEIILDGIFGTGFQGRIEKPFSNIIEDINNFKNVKIAIDIPSGVNGDSGIVEGVAIKADYTFFLELPKSGFFLNQGWDHVGKLERIGFGLKEEFIDEAEEEFYLLNEKKILKFLPKVKRSQNKYDSFVVGITGSSGMEGAANLSGLSALRSGAGIIKLFMRGEKKSFWDMAEELVKVELDFEKEDLLLENLKKAKVVYIGPGLGRGKDVEDFLLKILPKIKVPCVLDADALFFFANNLDCKLPKEVIMTPHKGEMERLVFKKGLFGLEFLEECQKFCEKFGIILVLKGAPTFVFQKGEKPIVCVRGSPALATAGTGDVLTGMIAALLARGVGVFEAALLGVFLHGVLGEMVEREKGVYSVIASDLIGFLPRVFQEKFC
jgi:NAD(P)H-hydrate epimerase